MLHRILLLVVLSVGWTAPGWAETILATDDFNRADSGTTQVENLGANWTTNTGSTTKFFKLLTNAVKPVDNANDVAERYSALSWPADQCSKVTLPTLSAAGIGTGYGVGVRMDTGGAHTFYRFIGGGSGYELGRMVTGALTSIASGSGTTFAGGDTIKLCVSGSATVALSMYKNDVEFDLGHTDVSGSKLTAGAAGIAYSSAAGGSDNLDTWIGSSLASGGAGGLMLLGVGQ